MRTSRTRTTVRLPLGTDFGTESIAFLRSDSWTDGLFRLVVRTVRRTTTNVEAYRRRRRRITSGELSRWAPHDTLAPVRKRALKGKVSSNFRSDSCGRIYSPQSAAVRDGGGGRVLPAEVVDMEAYSRVECNASIVVACRLVGIGRDKP